MALIDVAHRAAFECQNAQIDEAHTLSITGQPRFFTFETIFVDNRR